MTVGENLQAEVPQKLIWQVRAEILRTSKRLPAPTPMGTSNMVHHHTGDQQYGAPSHWGPAIWCTITPGTSNMVHHHTGDQQYGAPSHLGPAIWCTITPGTSNMVHHHTGDCMRVFPIIHFRTGGLESGSQSRATTFIRHHSFELLSMGL